jgi:amino acid permease
LKAYKSIGKLFDYGTASELRGILGGWTYLFFHASFTLISTIFADNVLGVKKFGEAEFGRNEVKSFTPCYLLFCL